MQTGERYQLNSHCTLLLPVRAGDRVRVTRGHVWLTLQGHSRDVWIQALDTWCVPLGAQACFGAQEEAEFTLIKAS